MYIERVLEKSVTEALYKGKAVILYGARQVGKTTLLNKIAGQLPEPKVLYLDAEDPTVRKSLAHVGIDQLRSLVGGKKLFLIDEAQMVPDIGSTLKLIVDHIPTVQVIATGSSSFELANKVTEPLTGRAYHFTLYPLSLAEVGASRNDLEMKAALSERIVYGMYPEVVAKSEGKEEQLRLITKSYVYKDVLQVRGLRNTEVIDKLLQALALQVGNEVSFNELAGMLGVSQQTVQRYLSVLEQAFIVFRLRPYSRNKRKELTKLRKVYFWDTGVRNALINNLNPLDLRTDSGALWENFWIAERMKLMTNSGRHVSNYFWRTLTGQEIDYVEEEAGHLAAFECKLSEKHRSTAPPTWRELYPKANYIIATPENALTTLR